MVKAGEMTLQDFMDTEACMSRSVGHCMTMGTASTMASMVEALGIGLAAAEAMSAAGIELLLAAGFALQQPAHVSLPRLTVLPQGQVI